LNRGRREEQGKAGSSREEKARAGRRRENQVPGSKGEPSLS